MHILPNPKSLREIPHINIFRKVETSKIQEPFRGTALIGNPHYAHKIDTGMCAIIYTLQEWPEFVIQGNRAKSLHAHSDDPTNPSSD